MTMTRDELFRHAVTFFDTRLAPLPWGRRR
jgi:hypothetical protein